LPSQSISKIERKDGRVVKVTIHAEPVDMVIIEVYMPTSTHDDEEIDNGPMCETLS
jgi:exonuclease III